MHEFFCTWPLVLVIMIITPNQKLCYGTSQIVLLFLHGYIRGGFVERYLKSGYTHLQSDIPNYLSYNSIQKKGDQGVLTGAFLGDLE